MMDVLDRLKKWSFGIEPDSVKVEILMCDFKQIVAEMDRLTTDNARLTALCDRYRGEVEALKEALDRIAHPVWWMQEDQLRATGSINGLNGAEAVALSNDCRFLKSIAERALAGAPIGVSAEPALTRARAEWMEEAIKAAEEVVTTVSVYPTAEQARGATGAKAQIVAAIEACRLAEQANKGE